MTIQLLTDELLREGLHCPSGRSKIELCDTTVRGLRVEVTAASPGTGTYYYSQKVDGRRKHQRLGSTEDLALEQARCLAMEIRGGVRSGSSPDRLSTTALTFDEFFERHYLPYVRPRKRSWKRDVELYRRVSAVFGSKALGNISRQEIVVLLTRLHAEGLADATANHHVKLIRQALNLAVEWDMLDKNPAARIRLLPVDNLVQHCLDPAQLQRLMTVLRTHPNRAVCRIAILLLCTGCRLNEVLSARWSDVDRANRLLLIRAANSKSRKLRSVPLNDGALEVLNELDTEGSFDHVFINRKTGKPYTAIAKTWGRIRAEAGFPFLRIHDLRHQFASMLVNSGRSLYEVQMLLGHADPKITTRYAHLSSKSLQEASSMASQAIANARTTAASIKHEERRQRATTDD